MCNGHSISSNDVLPQLTALQVSFRQVAAFKASHPQGALDRQLHCRIADATWRWMLVNFRSSMGLNRVHFDLAVSQRSGRPRTSITVRDYPRDDSLSITGWILSNFPPVRRHDVGRSSSRRRCYCRLSLQRVSLVRELSCSWSSM